MPDGVLPEPQLRPVDRWFLLAASAVLLLSLSLLAVAGVGAFAVYTWGWRDKGEADERRIAEAQSKVVQAARCGQRLCITRDLIQEAPQIWRVRLEGAVNECHLLDLDHFVARGRFIEGASRIPCTRQPLRHPWLTVAVATASPPFLNPPLNAPTGYERDVIVELMRRLRISDVRWKQVPPDALQGRALQQADLGVDRIVVPARHTAAHLSSPYFTVRLAVIARRGQERTVRTGIRKRGARLGLIRAGFKPPYGGPTIGFSTMPRGLAALTAGRMDGLVLDIASASVAITTRRSRLAIVGQWPTDYGYGFALQEGNPFGSSVNRALAAMRADKTLDELQGRWFPETTRAPLLSPG